MRTITPQSALASGCLRCDHPTTPSVDRVDRPVATLPVPILRAVRQPREAGAMRELTQAFALATDPDEPRGALVGASNRKRHDRLALHRTVTHERNIG